MYKLIEKSDYDKLVLIGQLAAQQMYFQHDFLELAKSISIEKANNRELPEDVDRALFTIEMNLNQFMTNSAILVALMTEMKIVKMVELSDDETEPTPPEKPAFKVVK